MFTSPLGQFNVETIWFPVLGYTGLTNWSFVWILIAVLCIILPDFLFDTEEAFIGNNKIVDHVDSTDYLAVIFSFIPYFFSRESVLMFNKPFTYVFGFLFFYILVSNLYGLLPFADTSTATLHVPFFLSFSAFLAMNVYACLLHGFKFLGFFVPSAPWLMKPLLAAVEIISHLMKCVSLSVRLFANLFAGHVLMHILGGSTFFMLTTAGLFVIALLGPFLIFSTICVMEIFVALLQAYVFVTLVAMYFGDLLTLDEGSH